MRVNIFETTEHANQTLMMQSTGQRLRYNLQANLEHSETDSNPYENLLTPSICLLLSITYTISTFGL